MIYCQFAYYIKYTYIALRFSLECQKEFAFALGLHYYAFSTNQVKSITLHFLARQLHDCIASSFDCFIGLSESFMYGQRNYSLVLL